MTDVLAPELSKPGTSGAGTFPTLRRGLLTLLASVLGLWAIPYLARPFGLDHGQFGWAGDVIVGGGISYRDAWDVKGPVVHVAFAILRGLFGHQTWVARAVDILIMATGAWLLGRAARSWVSAPGAWAVALVFLAWYLGLDYENSAQPDGWAGIILIGVVVSLCRHRSPSALRSAVSGALIGVCFLVKPTYALCGIMALTPSLVARDRSLEERVRAAGWTVTGAALLVATAVGWLAWRGALTSYVDIMQYAAVVYSRNAPLSDHVVRFGAELIGSPSLGAAFVLAVFGLISLFRSKPEVGWLMSTWLASTAAVLILGGWFYPYHWLPVYPVLSVLAVVGVEFLSGALGHRLRRFGRALTFGAPAVASVILAAPSLARAGGEAVDWWRSRRSAPAREDFERRYFGEDGRHPASLLAVADFLRRHTDPGEPVGYFGTKAGIYYFADRPAVTRFGQTQPLLGGADNPFRRRYRAEFLAAFDRRPPRYLVARQKGPCVEAGARPPFDCLDRFPEFAAVVKSRYVVDTLIGKFVVHRLATPGSGRTNP